MFNISNSKLTTSSNCFSDQKIIIPKPVITNSTICTIKRNLFGKYQAYAISGKQRIKTDLNQFIKAILAAGVGELLINNIDRDGTFQGYDIELINRIAPISSVPIVANGGAKSLDDLTNALNNGASAVAAGSLFVYRGAQKGIMINYPTQATLFNEVYYKL